MTARVDELRSIQEKQKLSRETEIRNSLKVPVQVMQHSFYDTMESMAIEDQEMQIEHKQQRLHELQRDTLESLSALQQVATQQHTLEENDYYKDTMEAVTPLQANITVESEHKKPSQSQLLAKLQSDLKLESDQKAPKLPPAEPTADPVSPKLMRDAEMLRLVFQLNREQQSNLEKTRQFRIEAMHEAQQAYKKLEQEILNAKKELSELEKQRKISEVISTVATVVAVLGLIGSIFATLFTSGAAAPTVLAAIQGVAALTEAGNTVAKTRCKAQLDEIQKTMVGLRAKSSESRDTSRAHMQDSGADTKQLSQYFKDQRKLLEIALRTSQAMVV